MSRHGIYHTKGRNLAVFDVEWIEGDGGSIALQKEIKWKNQWKSSSYYQ